jgi:two-component system response regulator PilR (NtrC family)
MTKQRILVVDDEPDIRELLEITLLRMGLEAHCAADFSTAKMWLKEAEYDLCLTDMKLPDGDGITLVKHIQQHCPNTPTAVITAHGSIDMAIKAMKAGAFDFVSKPVSLETLRNLVNKALTLPSSIQQAEKSSRAKYKIIGESNIVSDLRRSIAKFARSQAPVFIQGQSGTGKELVARQIHLQGSRAEAPFIAVNCGAIPSELMESEFFGHIKGSFTGAVGDSAGLFKAAQGGTLFLDEIADLPLSMQVKLLRVIQEKTVRPVGSQEERATDVRIISASHKDLEAMVNQGAFRQDLYYRINVIAVVVPSLAEREGDIALITHHIIGKLNKDNNGSINLEPSALKALQNYNFPGNIRELENILERATALCDDNSITTEDLQLPGAASTPVVEHQGLRETSQLTDKEIVVQALTQNRWNQSATARAIGITLRQLRYKMEKLGLNKP